MKYLILFVVFGLVLYASNPSLNSHQNAISRELVKNLKDDASSITGNSILGSVINEAGAIYAKEYMDIAIKKVIVRRDYFFFSYSDFDCLSLSPFEANTPPNDPVRKIANVLSKSMKAASLGA